MTQSVQYRLGVMVLQSYLGGMLVGNLLWLPWTGPLAIAFAIGGAVLAIPLCLLAVLVVNKVPRLVLERPLISCLVALFLVLAIYLLVDQPISRPAVERLRIAVTCDVVGVIWFYVLAKRFRSATAD